ncbi:MAG TPA: class I SAM-dependent methyltransferase [Candidatus Koribacter sp.]|jgi:2-polyprenyl-3-methyl-5-hydroxy-6-metoxy-1,4-benzoquinol methylase
MFDTPRHNQRQLNALHASSQDVWHYSSIPRYGYERFAREAAMLDAARGESLFANALEVGCHEGAFTEWLSSRCSGVLALDFSPVVLERARRNHPMPNVEYRHADLRTDSIPGEFDLVVAVSVLETFRRPGDLRKACEKLVKALRPGGYLLIGNVRGVELYESSWWGRKMLRGGVAVADFLSRHPCLREVTRHTVDFYVETLLQRNSADEGRTGV